MESGLYKEDATVIIEASESGSDKEEQKEDGNQGREEDGQQEQNMDKVMQEALEAALKKLKQKRSTVAILRIIDETNLSEEHSLPTSPCKQSVQQSIFTPKQLAKMLKEDFMRARRNSNPNELTEKNIKNALTRSLNEGKLAKLLDLEEAQIIDARPV